MQTPDRLASCGPSLANPFAGSDFGENRNVRVRGSRASRGIPLAFVAWREATMIENPELAAIFDEIADCLEIQSGNPFRIRAYRNAARVLQGLPEPAALIVSNPARPLTDLPGIGKDLAEKIRTIVETGDLPLR